MNRIFTFVLLSVMFVLPFAVIAQEVTTEANIALVQNFIDEVFNEAVVENAGDYITPEYIQNGAGIPSGLEALQGSVLMLHTAFPDIQYTITHIAAEGDLVAARLIITGTQEGDFMGIPATGRFVNASAINFWRVEDGLLAEHWEVLDGYTFLQQLGAIPGGVEGEPLADEIDLIEGGEANAEESRAVIDSLYEDVLNVQDVSAAGAVVAEDFIWYNPFAMPGLVGFQGFYSAIFEAFPDVQREAVLTVADGDLVFVLSTITGTHLGGEQLYGVPPTGNPIEYASADIFRVEDAVIVEQWDVADYVTLFGQIGLLNQGA